MLDILEIKTANDTFFGLVSELSILKEPGKYGSEYAYLAYSSPTGKILCNLRFCRNTSNNGEWYYMNGLCTRDVVNLETLPNFGGVTKAAFREMIARNDENNRTKASEL